MKITQESDYALRVILYLYKLGQGKRLEARLIAEHENIPLRFLLKLLRKLVVAGIVNSYMGNGGGYTIEKTPQFISLKDVIEAVEGTIFINRCLYDPSFCNLSRTDDCKIHDALEKIQSRFIADLTNTTFADILKDKEL
jgi:Rrf2 family transcriptional regulator, iron-sulfur cluster assembly transcription factor